MRYQSVALLLPLLAASCAQPGPTSAFDGTYAGPFRLETEVSPMSCPRVAGSTDTGDVVMTVRDGAARIDLIQGAYFSGRVGQNGALSLISGQGELAFINGRIDNGVFNARGAGTCQYLVQLQKRPA